MALAILEFLLFDRTKAKFRIDTGTSAYYKLKVGRSISDNNGIQLVDGVTHSTPLQKSGAGDYMLNASREVALPAAYFDRENCYVQLFSCKTPDGKSPAWSEVVKVPVGMKNTVDADYLLSLSKSTYDMAAPAFNSTRTIPHAVGGYSGQQSIEDILGTGLKMVAPVVLKLLGDMQSGSGSGAGSATSALPAGMLNNLLQMLLQGLAGAPAAGAGLSTQKSVMPGSADNRFHHANQEYARPFVFGIDDALLATLAGPIIKEGLQLLPQLLTATNQGKLQKQAQTNKLVTDLLADTNKRLLLQQLMSNQAAGQAAAQAAETANITQVLQLLQEAAAAAPPAGAPAVAKTQSLSVSGGVATSLSASANLVFAPAGRIQWNGAKRPVYSRNGPVSFKLKLNVPEPAPKSPLPKAIYKFYFKEVSSQKVVLEKMFRQKNVAANTFLDFAFTKEEVAALPLNSSLMLFAEIRWQTQNNKEVKALGSTEVIMVNSYFVKDQGKTVSDERELNDMKVYRAFWNKVWEAPVLDAAGQKKDGIKKYQWELNANMRFSFTLTADHDTNGLMETKIMKAPGDPDSMTEKTSGRMKAGTELSIEELNKLSTLWDKTSVLPDAKMEALKSPEFAKNNAAELINNVKLAGKAGQRGMVWVMPVLKLTSVILNKVKTTLPTGEVSEVEEESIQFPLPVAGRIIGLKSA